MKIFKSVNEYKKYFFPKQYEKDRLAKMTPKEQAQEMIKQLLERLKVKK